MSGHSKWKKIKRQKESSDQKKGNLFTKLGQAITTGVKEGGGKNPDMNFMLRIALDKAKEANMPKDTIERAIDKGAGISDKGSMEDVTYEVVGEGGVAILIDCMTDNRNRTISEIRNILSGISGFSIGSGSVGWQFKSRGRVVIQPFIKEEVVIKGKKEIKYNEASKEDLILEIMEIEGVEDISERKDKDEEGEEVSVIDVFVDRNKLQYVYNEFEKKNIKILKAEIVKIAKNEIDVDEKVRERINTVIKQIEALEDVSAVWTNINLQ